RKRRWRNLGEFREALLPFLPARPSVGGVGLRVVAYGLDTVLLLCIGLLLSEPFSLNSVVFAAVYLGYYGALEGIWGGSLGKRSLGLAVGTPLRNQPPGVGPALLRAGVLYVLLNLGEVLTRFLPEMSQRLYLTKTLSTSPAGILLPLALALLVSTMR